MTYGEKFTRTFKDFWGETCTRTFTYKFAKWDGIHTNDEGDGLWDADGRQLVGTCDFTVRGCVTEKAAKAKIRRYFNRKYN